jgi:hypothetical protein
MDNVMTAETEWMPQNNVKKSILSLPINEDWAMVIKVTEVVDGIVKGHKIWDNSANPKLFNAKIMYLGQEGEVPENIIEINSFVVFYRCGEYNNIGSDFPELHEENQNGYSWICFVSSDNSIIIEDKGGGIGEANGEQLQMIPADPLNFFHNSAPAWAVGRKYAGKKIQGNDENDSYFVVFLPGRGNIEKTFNVEVGETTLILEIDGQGNVIDFRK